MSKLDRRTIITAAGIGAVGATIALTGCSAEPGNSGENAPEEGESWPSDQWGEDPHAAAPKTPPPGGFDPKYLCIVYVKFTGSNMIVRHGYIASPSKSAGETPAENEARHRADAEAMLNEAAKEDWKVSRLGHPRKEVNFERFDFGQQMRLFFFIDNDGIAFDGRKKDGKYANLLRFVKHNTTSNMDAYKPRPVDPNHAFFGATLVPLAANGKERQALRLDNWYCGPKGKPVDPRDPSTHQFFAMDLNLLWAGAEAGTDRKSIPIIIDPDGGNMGSQP